MTYLIARPRTITRSSRFFVLSGLLLVAGTAEAQISPGGGGGGLGGPGGAGGPGSPGEDAKKEGVAEAAPKLPGLQPTTPTLPPPKSRRKRKPLFEIDGYYRLRTDWFKNFNEGFVDDVALGGAPFPRALGCGATTQGHPCDGSLSSANMRLRLEPTINLNEGTSVHVQADLLDNLVLGSTPAFESYTGAYDNTDGDRSNDAPLGAFTQSQDAPQAGVNSNIDSVRVKRAWAEVALPLGILKVGRQPNHWGMGIQHNSGDVDPATGLIDLDADYGDTVDRASFSAPIPGTKLRGMLATDWSSTRLTSNQTDANKGREGHPWDLDDSDDVTSYVGVISRLDAPQDFRDKVDRGARAFNYGVYFEYRQQKWDTNLSGYKLGDAPNVVTPATGTPSRYTQRGLKMYSPDLWLKFAYKHIQLEGEFSAQLGHIASLEDYAVGLTDVDVRKYGGSGRFTWKGVEGKLRIGVESGAASGDQWDNTVPGRTNIAYRNELGNNANDDHKLTQFLYDRDYRIDMILFRHLIGAVTNAGYVKPFLGYDFTKSIGFKFANITSYALNKVATPGNARMLGTEFNADLSYATGGLSAGIAYGVLFPFAALSHPGDPVEGGKYGFGTDAETGVSNVRDATTSHTIQLHLGLRF